jgi:hypothetical protein
VFGSSSFIGCASKRVLSASPMCRRGEGASYLSRTHPKAQPALRTIPCALPPRLRNGVLLIKDKEASGATADDAELLATYQSGFTRGQDGFTSYVQEAMA